jgi:hypothetical protein
MPLADVMVLNLDHYRLDAGYKHGLHFTALPTAWVAGREQAARAGQRGACLDYPDDITVSPEAERSTAVVRSQGCLPGP